MDKWATYFLKETLTWYIILNSRLAWHHLIFTLASSKWFCSLSVLFFHILCSNMNLQNLPVLFTISELPIIRSAFKTQQVASVSYNFKNLASMLLCKSDYIS